MAHPRVEELPSDDEGDAAPAATAPPTHADPASAEPAASTETTEKEKEETTEARIAREIAEDTAEETVDEAAAGRLKNNGNVLFGQGKLEAAFEAYDFATRRLKWRPLPKRKPMPEDVPPLPDSDGGKKPSDEAGEDVAAAPIGGGDDDGKKASDEAAEEPDTTDYTLLAQVLCNAGFIRMKQGRPEDAIKLFNDAIRHDGDYAKAYFRRGHCHFDTDQWSLAHGDFEKCVALGLPLDADSARKAAEAKRKADEEMQKMWGQLKDLGNMFLGKFGLSTDNFKFEKDAKTGGYSMNFVQNAAPAGGAPPT